MGVVLRRSVVSEFAASWTVARQAPPFMEFSRQEYWSGVPFPILGDLPDPVQTRVSSSPALAGKFFTTCSTWEALVGAAEGNNWCTYVGPIRGIIKMQESKRDGKAP